MTTAQLRHCVSLIGCVVSLVALVGCGPSGPELAPVIGRVTLDGQPLHEAVIMFQPDEMQSPSYAVSDVEGKYELGYKRGVNGALVGWHAVSIEMDTEIDGPNGKVLRRPQLVPPRYNSKTELRREVKSGEVNTFDFDLTTATK